LLSAAQYAVAVASIESIDAFQLRRSPMHKSMKPDEKNTPAVVKAENKVREHARRVMDSIDKFRAEICAKMKKDHGISFDTFSACAKFMKKTCKPGKDNTMDGDHHEVSSGEGYCTEYFPEAEKKAEEEVTAEEILEIKAPSTASGPQPGPAPAPQPAPAPAPAEKAPAPAPKKSATVPAPATKGGSPGPAPAPGPMGGPGPGPAPVPARFIPGVSGGKPWGPIGKDEAWYYKGGGTDDGRMHMKESMKLPTQGYWGKLVEHEDGETQTGDWQQEFGPNSGHDSLQDVCKHHPDSEWCMRRGWGSHHKSSASTTLAHLLPVAIALLATLVF